jgi:hypothetical protein
VGDGEARSRHDGDPGAGRLLDSGPGGTGPPGGPPAFPAGAAAPASPVATAAQAPAAAVRYYDCTRLLSAREARQATGLSSTRFFHEEKGQGGPATKGQTYCQFFAAGSDSIAVSVFTGPSFSKVFQPLAAASQNLPVISGIGDTAKWSDQATTLGVRVGSAGLTIIFQNTGSGPLAIPHPKQAALAMAKLIVPRL